MELLLCSGASFSRAMIFSSTLESMSAGELKSIPPWTTLTPIQSRSFRLRPESPAFISHHLNMLDTASP